MVVALGQQFRERENIPMDSGIRKAAKFYLFQSFSYFEWNSCSNYSVFRGAAAGVISTRTVFV